MADASPTDTASPSSSDTASIATNSDEEQPADLDRRWKAFLKNPHLTDPTCGDPLCNSAKHELFELVKGYRRILRHEDEETVEALSMMFHERDSRREGRKQLKKLEAAMQATLSEEIAKVRKVSHISAGLSWAAGVIGECRWLLMYLVRERRLCSWARRLNASAHRSSMRGSQICLRRSSRMMEEGMMICAHSIQT